MNNQKFGSYSDMEAFLNSKGFQWFKSTVETGADHWRRWGDGGWYLATSKGDIANGYRVTFH